MRNDGGKTDWQKNDKRANGFGNDLDLGKKKDDYIMIIMINRKRKCQ